MPKFLKNFIKDFLNIYVDDKTIRDAYGEEYAGRFKNIDPVTGKKKISASKIIIRVLGVIIAVYFLILLTRVITYSIFGPVIF